MESDVVESFPVADLIQEARRLRSDLAQNVATLRITLERSKAVAAETGWRPEPPVDSTQVPVDIQLLGRLTRRELEVLRLIAEGKSTKQAAAILGMAFRTAVCHRYRIFQKLHVHETASLVRLAVRAGLVKP